MNKPLKLISIGNSTGVVIPKELLRDLNLSPGDSLYPVKTPAGFELRAANPEFEAEMEIMRDIMTRRAGALRELAK